MTDEQKPNTDKGGLAEECLREYFRELGSFVLRGVPVWEGTEEVTDIDLWIYTRSTAHSRHIAIVDVKNKKRSKPYERAIWVKGLQITLGANESIIASQGIKESAQRFSERLNVRVISKSVFEAIIRKYASQPERLNSEELNIAWRATDIGKINIKSIVDLAKSEISNGINFQTLNTWLDQASDLLKLSIEREKSPGPILRAAYMCAALLAIGADFLAKDHSLSDRKARYDHFKQGMMFGTSDTTSSKSYLDFAENVVTEFLDPSGSAAAQIRYGFEKSVEKMPILDFVDYFSKPHSSIELLKAALALEVACHARNAKSPKYIESIEAKILLGLIGDYAGLRRKDVLGTKESVEKDKDFVHDSEQIKLI